MYCGKVNLIKKHLGFLIDEFNMKFRFQSFDNYKGFCGPIDTYSFYNENGCLTFHNIVQKAEWGLYKAEYFSTNQFELLKEEIILTDYLTKNYLLISSWLKDLSRILYNEATLKGTIFEIKIK